MRITNSNNITFIFDKKNHTVAVSQEGKDWVYSKDYRPYIDVLIGEEKKRFYFADAKSIKSEFFSTGVADGMRTDYKYWQDGDNKIKIHLRTLIWVHKTSGRLYFELIPMKESEKTPVVLTQWPNTWAWERTDANAYSLLPLSYGSMVPSNYSENVEIIDHPHFVSVYGSMAWLGQVDNRKGYIGIVETPFDASYKFCHKPDSATVMGFKWQPSLGKINYRRVMRMEFFNDCDYVTLAKSYRNYIKEKGDFITLKQKSQLLPKFDQLVGSPIIHSCIYYNIKPEAVIYNKDKPESNYRFSTFDRRADQIAELANKGLKKGYLHLDGWGVDGYDREHPDIMPPCEKAGGEKAMKRLIDKCRENNILFTLHDQYRDYYFDARSYDKNNAVMNPDGKIPEECTWNGGDQNYLCQTMAHYYVERNYDMLRELGLEPDGVYLDVFSCVRPDECSNPEHLMTRKESFEYRSRCMALLATRGIIMSSETMVDQFVPYLILCHYFPGFSNCDFYGIKVPLFNLCYHDCAIVPWTIHEDDEEGVTPSRYLYSLLNGGPSYLDIDADEEQIKKINTVCELQEKIVFSEMVSHEFLSDDFMVQRTKFDNGVTVTVNFNDNTYKIEEE